MKIRKTNAARLLDKGNIPYELKAYSVDKNDLSAQHVAKETGEDINRIFKTLLLRGDKNIFFVCVIPGAAELDLKKAAKASGNKSCSLLPQKDLLSLTGYMRGGCSPIGMKKQFPTFVHQSACEYDTIFVSAGQRGLQLLLSPHALCSVTNAFFRDLV